MHTYKLKTWRIKKVTDLHCKFYTNGRVIFWQNGNADLKESGKVFSVLRTLLRQMRCVLQ